MNNDLHQVIKFLHLAEKLKCELRHGWLTSGRQESVADHTWRMSLMVMLMADKLQQPVDTFKCLKMAIVHDLVEAQAGDVPVHAEGEAKQMKAERERKAIEHIHKMLPGKVGQEIYDLWHEFEDCETFDAKFVKALDKIEAFLQHNESDLSTWLQKEKLMVFQDKWKIDHCRFDETMLKLALLSKKESIEKLKSAGEDIEMLEQEAAS